MGRPPFVVSCVPCDSYGRTAVEEAVREAFRLSRFFPLEAVPTLLKANLLSPSDPSRAVTTHPEILRALLMELTRAGCPDVMIGDNPGYIFRHQEKALFQKTGVAEICQGLPVRFGLLSSDGFVEVRPPRAGILQTVRIPDFFVLDAVEGMEGWGPSHGKPKRIGWVAASSNALALDYVQAVMMGFNDPLDIPLLSIASKRMDGPSGKEDIELRGAHWEDLPCEGFQRAPSFIRWVPSFFRGVAHHMVRLKPGLNRVACIKCGICEKVCPVNAIAFSPEGWPEVGRKKCVQCLCCHEMCPTGEMEVRENTLSRLLRK